MVVVVVVVMVVVLVQVVLVVVVVVVDVDDMIVKVLYHCLGIYDGKTELAQHGVCLPRPATYFGTTHQCLVITEMSQLIRHHAARI